MIAALSVGIRTVRAGKAESAMATYPSRIGAESRLGYITSGFVTQNIAP